MMPFADPLIAGLELREDFVSEADERRLIGRMDELGLSPFRFQGWTGKRLTRSFGWRYDFDDASFTETEPIPDWLRPVREKAAAFAGLQPDEFAHALVIRYDPGASRCRRRTGNGFQRAKVELGPRSAYLLSGEVRSDWEHSIAAHEALRFSITFRSLSERGLRSRSAPRPATSPRSAR